MTLKIYAYFFVLLLAISLPSTASAQKRKVQPATTKADTTQTASPQHFQGVQYASREEAAAALLAAQQMPLFAGVSVSADVAGAVMAVCCPYGQYEAAARVNLKGRYFPIAEVGWGVSDHTNETTDLHYKVNAPYFRLGMDYNVAKDVRSGNRIFVGVRYAFTSFKFDVDGPDINDPVYGTATPFRYTGVKSGMQWGEIVAGLEAKVWGMLHLGWSFRYRMRIHNKKPSVDNAWYIPGYGKNDTHALGGTFNVIFDI